MLLDLFRDHYDDWSNGTYIKARGRSAFLDLLEKEGLFKDGE